MRPRIAPKLTPRPELDLEWDDVRLFLAVAETGSISAAARTLRLVQPTASRRLADLELRLGTPLFHRKPSGVSLTSAGERLVEPARKMAEWAGEVSRAAARADGPPSGLVRVATAPGVAFDFLAPFAAAMHDEHPELRLELSCSMHYVDLARGEADLALRMMPANRRELVTVATLEHANCVFVAERYARTLPKKPKVTDLRWIAWAPPFEQLPPNPQLAALIPDFEPAFTADNFLVMLRAMHAGMGAMVLGDVRHRFADTEGLVRLDLDLGPHAKSAIHLVAARSALDVPRIRAVAHLITKELDHARPKVKRR
ncbi:LysR family transcriptional regulator [Myxococcota bacterium]|nr:LysR family transcriptional regulator [Myxococcota bacterium]